MKCPECEKLNLKSILTRGWGSSTAMYCEPYYDEDGVYHHHDMNRYIELYDCSNGHDFTIQSKNQCPGCNWTK